MCVWLGSVGWFSCPTWCSWGHLCGFVELGAGFGPESSSRHFLCAAFQHSAIKSSLLYSTAAGFQKGTFQEQKPNVQELFKASACIKQVTWPYPESMWARTTQGCECYMVWIISQLHTAVLREKTTGMSTLWGRKRCFAYFYTPSMRTVSGR